MSPYGVNRPWWVKATIISIKLLKGIHRCTCTCKIQMVMTDWTWTVDGPVRRLMWQCSRKVFFGSSDNMSDYLEQIIRHFEKFIRHFNLIFHEKVWRWSDIMSDDFEQIIRHFAKSSAMSDGLMSFREHWCGLNISTLEYPFWNHGVFNSGDAEISLDNINSQVQNKSC